MWEDSEQTGGADAPNAAPKDSAEPVEKPAKAAKPERDSEVDKLRKEFEALRKERDELAASERYWAEQARGKGKPADEPEPEPEDEEDGPEDDTPDKQFEEFSAKGVEALVKRGLLTKKAAREIIRKEAEKIARSVVGETVTRLSKQQAEDGKLARDYPELSDEKSPLFARTRDIYREMVADDAGLKNSPAALRLAARTAKAELDASERDRRGRIARQGEQGSRNGGGMDSGDDDTLSPRQREILKAFNRDGTSEISEDAYLKRAKAGVQMSTRSYQPGQVDWR